MARQSLSPMTAVDYESTQEVLNKSLAQKNGKNKITHLKYLRKKSGYTLETLSEVTKISISYLSRLESGSRRLNTDLIRRLSIAFQCDPAELLQEVSHDCAVIAPVEFSKKKSFRFDEPKDTQVYVVEDVEGVFELTPLEDVTEYLPRSVSHVDGIMIIRMIEEKGSVKVKKSFFVTQEGALSPACKVILVSSKNAPKKMVVWSITPTSVQLCDEAIFDKIINGLDTVDGKITEVKNNTSDALYQIKAYMEEESCTK